MLKKLALKLFRFIHPTCSKCGTGKLFHIGTDMIGSYNTQVEVWECDECNTQFI